MNWKTFAFIHEQSLIVLKVSTLGVVTLLCWSMNEYKFPEHCLCLYPLITPFCSSFNHSFYYDKFSNTHQKNE